VRHDRSAAGHNGVDNQNIWPGPPHLNQRANRIACDAHFKARRSEVLGEPLPGHNIAINQLNAQHMLHRL
jgi:hypothetical protein